MHTFLSRSHFTPVKALRQHWQQPSFSYLKHPRPDCGLMLLLSGRIDFVSADAVLHARAGDIIFLPAQCYYEAVFRTQEGPIDNLLINFTAPSPCPATFPQRLTANAPLTLRDLFGQFVEENYPVISRPLRSRGLLCMLLDGVLAAMESPGSQRAQMIAHACALLQESTDRAIGDIARACSISESGLRQLFQESLGLSPARYRLQHKISRARYLLESTDMTVGEISDALGFFDAAYFCRVFRAHTGLTPRAYAKGKKL